MKKILLSLCALICAASALFAAQSTLPYEFKYDGKVYKGFEGIINGTLKVSVVRAAHPEYDESEYTVWFENIGTEPSAVLEDVYALKTTFKGKNPVLRGCLGDHNNHYANYQKDLLKENVNFKSTGGRATHTVFPYFDLVHGDWWGTIGTWELDNVKWPDKTFLESNEACHKLGMKVLVWFEPERVTNVEALSKNYGYKPEWGISTGRVITSNIGDPECLEWTLGRIVKMMGENGVDLYREDNNSNPGAAWQILDQRDQEAYSLPRQGINENKCICGHYALWDGIIDFCRKHGRSTFVDSCASGGGRNDIESMRRGVPFMRSDADRTTIGMRLSQSSGFNKWIPFHGSSSKETKDELEGMNVAPDLYITRASLLPIWNMNGTFSHNPFLDFDSFRRNLNLWKSVNHLLTKDFYHLSEWHSPTDLSGWTVFAYSDPEAGEAILTAFRQEECEQDTCHVCLPFADKAASYSVTDDDNGSVKEMSGADLAAGVDLTLASKRSSLLWRFKKI